jgi:hypothetical protein
MSRALRNHSFACGSSSFVVTLTGQADSMQRIYSTSDSQVARRLAAALSQAGVECHVSGEHVASTPGIHRTPAVIGVWLMRLEDVPKARSVMATQGLLVPEPRAEPLKRVPPLLLIVGIAAVLVAVVILLSAGK